MMPELNKIYQGDCVEIMAGWPDGFIDMIWTDPPYGHGNNDGTDLQSALADGSFSDRNSYKVEAIANDDMDSMRDTVDKMLSESARILKKDCCCCCCCCGGGGGPRPTFAWLAQRMDTKGLSFFHSVIWDKINPGLGWRYRRQHEMIMVAHRDGGKLAWNADQEAIANIIRRTKPMEGNHPNEKPIQLIEKMIIAHTVEGQLVVDPFCGSGTTLLACERLKRNWIGIELDPKYCEIAKSRIDAERAQLKMF